MKNSTLSNKLVGAASGLIALGALCLATQASAEDESSESGALIINEYNGVGPEQKLDDCNSEGDQMFGCVDGNGDDWIELVVTEPGTDIRGWAIEWKNGDGGGHANSGYVVFENIAFWSDLKAGTIITVRDNGGTNTDATDVSYNPCNGDSSDWVISVDALDTNYIQSAPTYDGATYEGEGFKTDNDCWRGRILDGDDDVVQKWVGENQGNNPACPGSLPTGIWDGGGVSNGEVGKLEADPVGGGWDSDTDYRDGDSSTFGGPNSWSSGSGIQSFDALCDSNSSCTSGNGCCDDTSGSGSYYNGDNGYDCYARNHNYYY